MKLFVASLIPNRSHIHFVVLFRYLGGQPALLVYVGLDHLGRQTRRQPAVLTPFEQHGDNDLWIAATAAATAAHLITTDADFDPLHPAYIRRTVVA